MKRIKITIVLNIILPIILGGFVYYLYSPEVWFVEKVDTIIGVEIHLSAKRGSFTWEFVRFYLLDMLWAYALVFALFFFMDNNAARLWAIFLLTLSFSCMMEILQLISVVNGTFDIMDIMAMLFAELVAVFVIKRLLKGGSLNETC